MYVHMVRMYGAKYWVFVCHTDRQTHTHTHLDIYISEILHPHHFEHGSGPLNNALSCLLYLPQCIRSNNKAHRCRPVAIRISSAHLSMG